MKYLTIGAVILLGVCTLVSELHPSLRSEMRFSAFFSTLAFALAAFGRYCERREAKKLVEWLDKKRPVKLMGALTALWMAIQAKAIILFAVVALGIGLIAWGVIELVYDAMTVVPKIQRNDIARATVTERPQVAARPIRLISATPLEIHEADEGSPMYRRADGTKELELEHSKDLINWQPWTPTQGIGVGFWRARK